MNGFFRPLFRRLRAPSRKPDDRGRTLRLESLEHRVLLAGDLAITELMASNATTLADSDGDWSDWIEIHNTGAEAVDLAGWTLTDNANDLEKWEFPSRTLAPDQYLVVFASGKNRLHGAGELHTNFKLKAAGEYLALVSPERLVVSEFGPDGTDFPPQQTDVSYGVVPAGVRYFSVPTPGAANTDGWLDRLEEPHLSVTRGFFTAPFQLEITSPTAGATVRYTTDGSVPTATHGVVYPGPITIRHTTTLRAAAFKPDFAPSQVATHTFLFLDDVLQQSETFGKDGRGLPPFPPWGGGGANGDWEVDPDIVHHANPASRLTTDDLRSIPTLSLTLPWDDMFGDDGQGIYIQGEGVPRAASIEQILADGSTGFQIDGAVQIQGGSSTRRWKAEKLSMRLKFKKEYGPTKLDYPIFGPEATDRFDTLVLDAALNDSWHVQEYQANTNAKYTVDQFVADLENATGGLAPHSRFHHLYINGLYWGVYNVHERPDASFAAAYLGGDKDEYDALKHNAATAVQGTNENYLAMLELARQDLSTETNYQNLAAVLDMDNFIDYMLVNFYVGNDDWAMHNWYATFNRADPRGKWRYHSWDAEISLQHLQVNVTGHNNAGGPTEIHHRLLQNAEYRLLFADHVQKRFFHDGVMTPAGATALYQRLMDEVDRAMTGESARWGDANREDPLTREDWLEQQAHVLYGFFPFRTDVVLGQLTDWDLFPDVPVPSFNQHGGEITTAFAVALTAAEGSILFTMDGTDPRLPGGAVSATAIPYEGPFQLARGATVKARTLHNGQWSALNEAEFLVKSELPLRITEINYNPHEANLVPGLGELPVDNDRFEFVELMNVGTRAIDVGGVQLAETMVDGATQGIVFTFAPQTLDPGAHLVVVQDRAAFASRYGTSVRIASGSGGGGPDGQYDGRLSNRGEQITLLDPGGAVIEQFAYRTDDGWPVRSDGWGSSLEVIDAAGDAGTADNWRASAEFGGSPGVAGAGPASAVVVNEVLSRGADGTPDQIELLNTTPDDLDLSGWYVSDDMEDLLKSHLPPGTAVAAGGYVVLTPTQLGFGLSGTAGDDVWLIESDGTGRPLRFVDHVQFAATDVGVSLGRWPNGNPSGILFPMKAASFGSANVGPVVGPVVVSEVHYHADSKPIMAEDFADGVAASFTPVLGTWAVRDGGYEVTPGAEVETIAAIATSTSLPTDFALSATVTLRSVVGLPTNAAFLFDYRSPTDFKFAAMFAAAGKWKIGQRDESGWHFLTEKVAPIAVDTEIDVTVQIRGSWVLFQADDIFLSYDFGTALNEGQVGVGSKRGAPRFESVAIERAGNLPRLEFLELVNTTATPIDLEDWQLRDAVELAFAPGTLLGVDQALVVVDFNPAEEQKAEFFRTAYGIDESVILVGPLAGNLGGGGQAIRLLKPTRSADAGFVLVDQVRYDNRPPWPIAADGHGQSLHRAAVAFGHSPASWSARVPTPGAPRMVMTGDVDLSGSIDADDIDRFARLLANPSAYQAAQDVSIRMVADMDGDGDVDLDDIDNFVALVRGAAMDAAVSARVNSGATQPGTSGATHRRASLFERIPAAVGHGPVRDGRTHRSPRLRQPVETAARRALQGDQLATARRAAVLQPTVSRRVPRPVRDAAAMHKPPVLAAPRNDPSWVNLADRVMETESNW